MDISIAVLSLIVAALAVFVGPFASWFLLNRQLASSLAVANKQIVAPMRQAWINNLRDLLAELTSSALHYHVSGFEEREDEEYRRLILLEHKIVFLLNPLESDHKQLEERIRQMVRSLERGHETDTADFAQAHTDVMRLSRQIFKREWNRVKERLQPVQLDAPTDAL